MGKIQEETGELNLVLGKLVATQGEWEYPWPEKDGTFRDLRREAEDEIADVIASCIFFAERNGLSQAYIQDRAEGKLLKYDKWRANGEG